MCSSCKRDQSSQNRDESIISVTNFTLSLDYETVKSNEIFSKYRGDDLNEKKAAGKEENCNQHKKREED